MRLLCTTTSSHEDALKASHEVVKKLQTSYSRKDLTRDLKYIEKAFENAKNGHELATILNNTSTLFLRLAKEEKVSTCTLHVPISICIMSRFPYFRNFESFLRQTEKLILERFDSSSKLPTCCLESSVVRFVREIVIPERGKGKIEFEMFKNSGETHTASPPSLNALPICDVSMRVLFDTLSLDDIMTLWWALLCEEKTIVLSEDTCVMGDVCSSLVSLLYPLKWCFARLDVVPCTSSIVVILSLSLSPDDSPSPITGEKISYINHSKSRK